MKNLLVATLFAVGLLTGASSTANAQNRNVTVHNQTGAFISHLYLRETGSNVWRQTRNLSLSDNTYGDVAVNGGTGSCYLDFAIDTPDGRQTWDSWNFCKITDITFTFNESTNRYRATGN